MLLEKMTKTMSYAPSLLLYICGKLSADLAQLHLGDYIYEGAQQGPRGHLPPRLTFTLFDYRTRHAQYRSDPDLQLLAQNHAWITTWVS